MLGSIFRKRINKISYLVYPYLHWFRKIEPNQITMFSLILSLAGCYFIIKKNYLLSLVFIIFSSFLDICDGMLAKVMNKQTRFGDYLDALVDRYREIIFYSGFVFSGFGLEAFFAATGSLIISYAKARTALTIKIEDDDWPAIGEMFDRLFLLVIGIFLSIFLPNILGFFTISLTLWSIALVTNIGAIQRIFYAKSLIRKYQTK